MPRAMSDPTTSPLRRNLARNILDLLRERGAAPGERLSRLALAEALGVSRTPVNGAIALLEELGAVRSEGRAVLLQTLDLDEERLLPGGEERGVARLLVAIARGRADGSVPDEVSERQLAQQFGVGRGVAAQALAQLAEAGVATRNRGHGWHVTAGFTSREERAASYRFRLLIEPAGLLEPGFALPAGFAARMQREHRRFLEKPWRDDDAVAFFEINAAFHAGLADASGNRFIAAAVVQQNRLRTLSNYSWRMGPDRAAVNVREHLAILQSVLDGDRDRAALQMRLHLADALALRPVPKD
ncbi:GntR family transcriptional regulator [Roseomonas sp. KE0001]|nr:GntR family transcriptional regulator [Roseomonas sp. KE0001]